MDDVASSVCWALIVGGDLALHHGRTVQVDPIKPTLKAPGHMLLKLRRDGSLSNFAFKFNVRRYIMGEPAWVNVEKKYGKVGRCSLTLSKTR